MKYATTLAGLMLVLASYAQNASKSTVHTPASTPVRESATMPINPPLPSAQVQRISSGVNYTYQFVSNRVLTGEQAIRWESRFPVTYPDLISISIDPQTQQVVIVLPNTHNTADFDSMLKRFGYSGYQLAN